MRTPPARRRDAKLPLTVLALLLLAGCTSLGDLGRLQDVYVTDDIHAWVGQEAATRAGAPVSLNQLTENERTLRDLAFALIEPPYDRNRWDAVLYEYGLKHEFQHDLWVVDPTAYYRYLTAAGDRSTMARYNKLIDDIHNDVVRIGPFFDLAHRVVDLDQRRQTSMDYLPDVGPPDRLDAVARVGENTLTIAWVQNSLAQRCAGYRFALNHLAVAEPDNVAAQADLALNQLQQQIVSNQLVQPPHFAGIAAPPGAIVK